MNKFSFVIQADENSALELQLGRFIPTAATDAAASAAAAAASAAQATAVLSSSLLKANNLSDLVSVTLARSNLGLGTAALQNLSAFLQPANNLSDLASAVAARTNLGLGSAATQNTSAFLQPANNLSDVGSAPTARTNLGLGTAATVNTGTSGATIPLLNAANTWALMQTFTVRPTFNGATPWDSANLNFAAPPAIGGTTPAAGKFTTLQATGVVTPSSTAGIVGTTANDNANAGSVGEFVSAGLAVGSAVSMVSSTNKDILSISLSAGDWDVEGTVAFNISSGASALLGWVNTASATLPAVNNGLGVSEVASSSGTTLANTLIPIMRTRINVASTTTVFLSALAIFSAGTVGAYGYIRARRVR